MVTKHYQIANNDRGLPKGEFALTEKQLDHYLHYLPSDIVRFLSSRDVGATAHRGGNEVRVSLSTNNKQINLDDQVAECIKQINNRTSGLSFFITREQ